MNKIIKQFFSISIILHVSVCIAQKDTALIEIPFIKNPRKTFEKYSISLPDSLKNGKYIRYTMWQQIAAEGVYKNNNKVGTWNYYNDNGQLTKTLDHTSQKIIFVAPAQNVYAQYFGDDIDLSNYVLKRMNELFSKEELTALKGKEYTVHFKVDENGKTTEVETRWVRGQIPITSIEQRLIKIVQEMPNWVITNSKKENHSFSLPVKF